MTLIPDVRDTIEPSDAAPDDDAVMHEHDAFDEPNDNDTDASGPPPADVPRSRKGRRASVPRWDEILFGAHQTET